MNQPQTQTNEVARLRAEVQRAIEDRNRIGIKIRGEYLPKLKKSENEVARLRELLNEEKEESGTYYARHNIAREEAEELSNEVARLKEAYLKSIERDDFLTQGLAASKAEVERLQTLPESRHKAFLDLLERGEKAQAEVKEIRSALGDDGRRTHKEILEMAFKASGWKLWKEKYIDLRNAHIAEGQDPAGTIWEHADKIQKELKASKAEVERLRDLCKQRGEKIDELETKLES
jgi:hypothetical protein